MPKLDFVAHLFKNLNEGAALRSNPLVGHFFAGTDADVEREALTLRRIRAAVRRAIDAVGEPTGIVATERERRQALVLRRCDLQGVPHKEVAAELGVGMRHFYRELRIARRRFAQAFQNVTPVSTVAIATIGTLLNVSLLELQRMRSLTYLGKFDEAVAVGERLANGAEDNYRIEALLSLGEAHAEAGNLDGITRLERALAVIATERFPVGRGAIHARFVALRARAFFVCGEITAACELQSGEFFRQANPLANPYERALWVLSLCQSSSIHASFGQYRTAMQQARLAQDLAIGYTGELATLIRMRVLQAEAETHLNSGEFSASRLKYQQAYSAAIENNIVSAAADIAMSHAVAELFDGNAEAALSEARAVLPLFESLGVPERGWHLPMAANIELRTGGIRRAIELLRAAQAIGVEGSERNSLVKTLEAECWVRLRRFAIAQRINAQAIAHFRRVGMLRPLGFSLSLAAETAEAFGNREAMHEHILEAVELLERYGHPEALARVLMLSARMTGDRAHARTAEEIRAAY